MTTSKTLIAYPLTEYSEREIRIVPAHVQRGWMNQLDGGNANRCLPLIMANQNGWFLLNPAAFTVRWGGEDGEHSVTIVYDEPEAAPIPRNHTIARSWFGGGVLTWHVGYLFRTPPGQNLLVRGPVNWPKQGIQSLEGLIESDWIEAPFTMNWKITTPDLDIRFEKDEPFCMITPIPRGDIERMEPVVRTIEKGSRLDEGLQYFLSNRRLTNTATRIASTKAVDGVVPVVPHELDYMKGQSADRKIAFADHQTRLVIRPFVREPER